MNKNKTALVVGANGVIGGNLISHLESLGDWDIIGLSRRGGTDTDKTRYISVDLLDLQDSKKQLSSLTSITHIFYAAYQDKSTWAELVAPNLAMLVNVVNTIESIAKDLQHISLMQGYKVYGAHYGPFKTPAKETDGGHMPPEFNIDQQQFLEAQQKGKKWNWSALRPSVVAGTALGNPMNLLSVIAVYASISKELGLPLRFPGKLGAYDKLLDITDARLLAKATVWAATNPACANQAFNITNGDLIRWNDLWPKIAAYFKMDTALRFKCLCKPLWLINRLCGHSCKKNITWLNTVMKKCQHGHLVTLFFHETTISSQMVPKPGGWVFTNISIPKKCFSICLTNLNAKKLSRTSFLALQICYLLIEIISQLMLTLFSAIFIIELMF
ncbi:SDR family oxidoreductase [Pedobacter riviphilus]|uniref:SDR family oxidoreductase n=1 Tax=Pedobacter riviphilus TaxID=2766984 RepID=UPI001CC26C5E|nr:SDR family oxidoreductase [Pedobacter riviphilus]